MSQITQLRANLGPAAVLGADLIGCCQTILVALTRATKLARATNVSHDSALSALIRLALTNLIARYALAILGVAFEVAAVLAGRAGQRRTSVTRRASRIVRAVNRAIGVQIIRAGADAEVAAGGVALGARGAAGVKLSGQARLREITEVPGDALDVYLARALTPAEAIEMRVASDAANA